MKKMYKMHVESGLKRLLLLFMSALLILSCAPIPSLPPGSTPPPGATQASPPNADVTPAPVTPTEVISLPPASTEWQDQIVYVLIWHKFYDGDPSNNFMRDQYNLPNTQYKGGFLGGDIAGIRQQMPYLKSLGITSVLLYPIFCNDEKPFFQYLATGYNVRDHRCIDPNFGRSEELVQLIEEFHSTANGPRINIILDLPMSTTGHEHPWRTSPGHYRLWNDQNPQDNIGCSQNYCEPYRLPDGTEVDTSHSMPILDHIAGMDTGTGTYGEIRDTIFWLVDQYDIDGFRYDSAHNFYPAFWVRFLSDFHNRYSQTKPNFWHIAEVFIWPPDQKSWQMPAAAFVNDFGMDSMYDFALQSFMQDVFAKGKDPNCIPAFGQCVRLLDHLVNTASVKQPERLMAQLDGYESSTFLKAVENGNGREKLYLASAFLMTINRVPLIYTGNEAGIDYMELGALFSGGLDQAYLEKFKKLVQIRGEHAAFRGSSLTKLNTTATTLAYARQDEDTSFIVVLNNAETGQHITIDLGSNGITCGNVENLLLENDRTIQLDNAGLSNGTLSVTMNPWEPKIIQCHH